MQIFVLAISLLHSLVIPKPRTLAGNRLKQAGKTNNSWHVNISCYILLNTTVSTSLPPPHHLQRVERLLRRSRLSEHRGFWVPLTSQTIIISSHLLIPGKPGAPDWPLIPLKPFRWSGASLLTQLHQRRRGTIGWINDKISTRFCSTLFRLFRCHLSRRARRPHGPGSVAGLLWLRSLDGPCHCILDLETLRWWFTKEQQTERDKR